MEAERFPGDYEGIIAGAPAYSWTGEMTGQAWNAHVLSQTSKGALAAAEVAVALSGGCEDMCGGRWFDRRSTPMLLDPAAIECTGAEQGSCLTHEQAVAVSKMYGGPKSSTGLQLYPFVISRSVYGSMLPVVRIVVTAAAKYRRAQ